MEGLDFIELTRVSSFRDHLLRIFPLNGNLKIQIEKVREIRDEIEQKVKQLIAQQTLLGHSFFHTIFNLWQLSLNPQSW